jgi:hypothetical protein
MLAAFLATLVSFTLPWNIAGTPCSNTGPSMTDLDSVKVCYVVSGTTQERIAFAGPVHGQEGQSMTVDIPTSQVATAYVQCKRPLSKWSCVSNFVTLNETLDVPPPPIYSLRFATCWPSATNCGSSGMNS